MLLYDNAPCFGCTDRNSSCHTSCVIYKNWKLERDKKCAEIKVKVKAENDVRGMKIDFVERYNRKTKRKRY